MMLGLSASVTALTPGNDGGLFVVEDALAQFNALKHHAEALAWRNPEDLGAPDPSVWDHYQGLVRNPHLGPPVFYVSQLDGDDGGTAGGYLHVVVFGSRTASGERLRSNLQQIGTDTKEAYPPVEDTWVNSIRFDGTVLFDSVPLPAYKHPGSMSLVDDVLFVPISQPTSDAPPGQLLLFDVSVDPMNPIPLQAVALSHEVDNVAVTRLGEDGPYRIWTNGEGGGGINVYDAIGTDLRDDTLHLGPKWHWNPATGLIGESWPTGSGAHQSSMFVRETDGTLFLIGMRHDGFTPCLAGGDFADLYRVDEPVPGMLTLTHLRTRHFNCVYHGGGGSLASDMCVCNMRASNNAYVSPSGELILYSIPHDDEDGFDPDIVRMGEFRHRDVNREGSPLRVPRADAMGPYQVDEGGMVVLSGLGTAPADRPWVELYDDDGFGDRSIVVDYDDHLLMELDNFNNLDDFGDKTSSVRWRSPVGLDIALYDDHDFGDRYIVLRGTGQTEAISNVGLQVVVTGLVEHFNPSKDDGESLDFNRKTSSLSWIGSAPAFEAPTLEWDLDGDSLFGETGSAALRGDEIGPFPHFNAASLDGPLDVQVSLRAIVPTVTDVGEDTAVVHVLNVAPTVTIDSLTGGLEGIALVGLPVLLEGSFSDVPADTHTAEVDWGDGHTTPADVDAVASTVAATHVYVIEGEFEVELAVTDDDMGIGTSSASLSVYDPSEAIGEVLDKIDALLGMPLDSQDLAALQEARDLIDGNKSGAANNGALDRLEGDDPIAALEKLTGAIVALDQITGTDVSTLKLLLALAANSVARTGWNEGADLIGPSPTAAQQDKLDEAAAWLADGEAKLAAIDYAGAVRSFRFATARALEAVTLL